VKAKAFKGVRNANYKEDLAFRAFFREAAGSKKDPISMKGGSVKGSVLQRSQRQKARPDPQDFLSLIIASFPDADQQLFQILWCCSSPASYLVNGQDLRSEDHKGRWISLSFQAGRE